MPSNIELMKIWFHGEALLQSIADKSPTILLGFSCGKDSIASWIALKESRCFERIILYYCYLFPDLQFVNDSIKYFEDYFGEHIYQLPHPSLYRWINNYVFQSSCHCKIIDDFNFPEFDYDDLHREFLIDLKLPKDTYIASGVRACDSLNRRVALSKWGPVNNKRHTFWPIWNWNKEQTITTIRDHGVKLPVDYEMFGRSFDGIDYRFLKPIKDKFPEDYQKIIDFFPMADAEIYRREFYRRHING